MSSKEHRKNAPWRNKETKVVRIPVVFVDTVLASDRQLDAGELLDEIAAPQWPRWWKYFVKNSKSGVSERPKAAVILERVYGDEVLNYGFKYFTDTEEAKAFTKVISEYLKDALLEFDLRLQCQTPEETFEGCVAKTY